MVLRDPAAYCGLQPVRPLNNVEQRVRLDGKLRQQSMLRDPMPLLKLNQPESCRPGSELLRKQLAMALIQVLGHTLEQDQVEDPLLRASHEHLDWLFVVPFGTLPDMPAVLQCEFGISILVLD